MCEPATLAMALTGLSIVTSAASGVVNYMGQARQAATQAAYQQQLVQSRDEQITENNQLANESFLQQARQVNYRLQEEDEKASQDIQQVQREAAQARATARVSAGEAGVSGLSVENLFADFYRQEAAYRDSVRRNRQFGRLQAKEDIKGLRAQAQGRIASLRPYLPEPVVRPNFMGTALEIGVDAFNRGSALASSFRTR